jgi:hypothetical protein
MPQMPDFTALGRPPAPQPAAGVATFTPGNPRMVGLAGQELATAGRDLQQSADIVAEANARQDAIVATDAANRLKQASINAEFDVNDGFRNVKEGNAVGPRFVDSYTEKLDNVTSSIRQSLQNDDQRRMFDQHADIQRLQFHSSLLAHQAQEVDKFNDSVANNTVDLSLRKMAQNPVNELTFQTELATINGTLKTYAERKGVSGQQLEEMKGKMLDAAYTSRITSLMNGVPGVVDANPYAAEKMFKQVADQLGPQAFNHLGNELMKSEKSVQSRTTAQSFIFGSGAVRPDQIAPAAIGAPLAGMEKVVMNLETGNQGDLDANGNPVTSPKGAKYAMQVMPATARDPGLGVKPAQNDSPQEYDRVGRDYLGALSARYNDPALVLAAYNGGFGNVDKWLAQNGDPRVGGISQAEWAAKIPFKETRDYVLAGLRKLSQDGIQPSGPVIGPSGKQLKLDLYARAAAGRKVAEQQYPGDTAYADDVERRIMSYGNQVLANQNATEQAAHDTLLMGLLGKRPDGSDAPKDIDTLLADPQMKAAWEQATPEARIALQTRLARGAKGFDEVSFANYYQLKGQAANDPEAFSQVDLGSYFGKMPDHALHELVQQQQSIDKKDAAAAARDLNWNRARSNVEDMLKPLGLGLKAKDKAHSADTEVFYGKLNEALQQYHDQNKKWPDTQTTRTMAAGLLTEGKQQRDYVWDASTRMYQSGDLSKFYVPLPSGAALKTLQSQFAAAMGHSPTQPELQQWYTRYKLSGGK